MGFRDHGKQGVWVWHLGQSHSTLSIEFCRSQRCEREFLGRDRLFNKEQVFYCVQKYDEVTLFVLGEKTVKQQMEIMTKVLHP